MAERKSMTRRVSALVRWLAGSLILRAAPGARTREEDRGPGAAIGWAFLASVAGSAGLATVYTLGGQPQLEGVSLLFAFGGLSAGLIIWAKRLMPQGPHVEERPQLAAAPRRRAEAEATFETGVRQVGRRGFLGKLLAAALGALGFAAVFPIRSLGTRPGEALLRTAWRPGSRAVTEDGSPVRAEDLLPGTVLTVFPEGHIDAADSPVLLIKLPDEVGAPGPPEWSPRGVVGFSKICTHAGCPVGLYQAETQELFCPCHLSAFSVPDGAVPTSGPATRALPQLPLALDADGFVIARSDFEAPVGPAFWTLGRRS